MRALALFSILSASACSNLAPPVKPTQGVYGYVRVDNEDAMTPIHDLLVAALTTTQTSSGMLPAGAPTAPTDSAGNYSIPLDVGEWTICLVDGAATVQCDCQINIGDGSQIERLYLREATYGADIVGWQGAWRGGNAASSCDVTLGS